MIIDRNFHVLRKRTLKSRGIKLQGTDEVISSNLPSDQLAEYRKECEELVVRIALLNLLLSN